MIFQQPNFFGCLEPRAGSRPPRADGALPVAHVDPLSLGVLEAPGATAARIAIGEGQAAGQPPVLRRSALRLPRRARRVHPPMPGRHRRRDDRRRGRARLRPHAADARAAHPPREGDVEHHHEPDAARARRPRLPLVARPAGPARAGGDLLSLAHHAKERLQEAGLELPFSEPGNVQGVCRRVGRPARRGRREARCAASIRATRSAATIRGSTTRCSSRSPRSARRTRSTASSRC